MSSSHLRGDMAPKKGQRARPGDQGLPRWLPLVGFVLGVVGIVAELVLATSIADPSPTQQYVFRTVLALAGAAFSLALTGFIAVQIKFAGRGYVVAGGTFAVFVVLFFFAPAVRSGQGAGAPRHLAAAGGAAPHTSPGIGSDNTTTAVKSTVVNGIKAPASSAPTITPSGATSVGSGNHTHVEGGKVVNGIELTK